jgi:hypothetical protein
MVLGSRGTALWIDTHTEDYFGRGDQGQRLAATSVGPEEANGDDRMVSTMEASVFAVCEDDRWTRLAIDEEEGRVAIGSVDGTVTVMEYA